MVEPGYELTRACVPACAGMQAGLALTRACVQVEMYADPAGRGGVLEAEGMVEIKFRTPELIAAMHRLDPVIASARAEGGPGEAATIRAREAVLLPVYRQAWQTAWSAWRLVILPVI